MRISKDPEVRRQEMIDTAMALFSEKGYDATSMADIAKVMNVVPGLCYRYFSSKQELFEVAIRQYAEESCLPFLPVARDPAIPIGQKLEILMDMMVSTEGHSRYSGFYHKAENQTFHIQLAVEMSKIMAPVLAEELTRLCEEGALSLENPRTVADFILHGLLSLWSGEQGDVLPFEQRVRQCLWCIRKILGLPAGA